MTNYQAILAMSAERMESFLDQVHLAGLNTGGYAARLEEERQAELLGMNPFDMVWLCAPAEAALISMAGQKCHTVSDKLWDELATGQNQLLKQQERIFQTFKKRRMRFSRVRSLIRMRFKIYCWNCRNLETTTVLPGNFFRR